MERFKKIGTVTPVSASQVTKSTFGLGFEKLDRGVFDPEKAYDKVAALGVKWIRILSGWARTEKQKGVYDFEWLDSIVDNLIERNLTPWMCLSYGNGLYSERAAECFGAVGCPPIETPEARDAWLRYTSATVDHFKDRVRWFEIWNEPDYISCWKTGTDGTAYGKFAVETAQAIRKASPDVKIIGGASTANDLGWLTDVIHTGLMTHLDAYSYHCYSFDERISTYHVKAVRALCLQANPDLVFIQGETGTPSRSDGAGGLSCGAWTPERQAKCLARVLLSHLFEGVCFNSYFSCMDMVEALDGKVGDLSSYLDFGYFGVLGADFDANGVATGNYTPKPSYRTLQVLSAVFREDFTMTELPVRLLSRCHSPRIFRNDDPATDIISQGFQKPDGSRAFVYWKPTELLTTTYDSTISIETAGIKETPLFVDLLTGDVCEIPENIVEKNHNGTWIFKNMPLRDYPLMITFGNFAEWSRK